MIFVMAVIIWAGGSVDAIYEPYINGEKELRQINEAYRSNSGLVK